jgi:anti-sigma factor RsiW
MSHRTHTMDPSSFLPLTDDEIHTLVDPQGSTAEHAPLLARLAQDPAAQAKFLKWQQQRSALRGLYQHTLDEHLPAPLLAAAQQTTTSRNQIDRWWRWGGMAATVLLAFGVGWLSHGQLAPQAGGASLSAAPNGREFIHQAVLAHAVYVPEVRHPVEVTAAQQEHLVQWLSKRLGKALKVPNLSVQGYELVGGRLLPGEGGARAQFMFQNAGGERVTLYLGALQDKRSDADARETAFRYSTEGAVPGFYWVDRGFGYALAGTLSREALLTLAEVVYQQL